jgi:FkbM family methyltransferase
MHKALKNAMRSAIRRMGYDIHRLIEVGRDSDAIVEIRQDAYVDIKETIDPSSSPVIFDVGANVGQTIDVVQKCFPSPIIHAFEPGKIAFDKLLRTHSKLAHVYLNNLALGSKVGRNEFFENSNTDMSSFLPLGPDGWGEIKSQQFVEVSTIDTYCSQHRIGFIDLLKSDTQGFDLEVLKGAKELLNARKIRLLYIELTFQKLYLGSPPVDEIFRFIFAQGFELVSFYKFYYLNGRVGWTDALFIQPRFQA